MDGEALDFGSVDASTSVEVHSPVAMIAVAVGTLLLLLALAAASVWFVRRSIGPNDRGNLRIWMLPRPVAQGVLLVFVALLCVQAVAVIGVYVHTQMLHDSVAAYFEYLSTPRLLGTTHAHLFGYAVMYGFIGFCFSLTSAPDMLKAWLVPLLVWSGVFDVASWWGIKFLAPEMHLVSIATAAITSIGSLLTGFYLLRDLIRERQASPIPATDASDIVEASQTH